ncbi:MAG: hypothetical protein KKD21_08635 [Proteobacteria bacterium]|nr:hypothetical protein [Pseudomonadota bacterium]
MFKKSMVTIMVVLFSLVSFSMTFASEGPDGEDILDIYSYFYKHASDSPSPATCK